MVKIVRHKIASAPFFIADQEYGKVAVTRAWNAETAKLVHAAAVDGLHITDKNDLDLEFLKDFPALKSLSFRCRKLFSVDTIYTLIDLLHIKIDTCVAYDLDYSRMGSLISVDLMRWPDAISAFRRGQLRAAFIDQCSSVNFNELERNEMLERLVIYNSEIETLEGIDRFPNIKNLRLANIRNLTSLGGVSSLKKLEKLELNNCNQNNVIVMSIDEIGQLYKLKELYITHCNNVASIRPIRLLKCLEYFNFTESTNIVDGDMSPIFNFPSLGRVGFVNRRHYSHSSDEIRTILSEMKATGVSAAEVQARLSLPTLQNRRLIRRTKRDPSMTTGEFWENIQLSLCSDRTKQVAILTAILHKMTVSQIREFMYNFQRLVEIANSWDLWGAFYVIRGGCSDDEFEYCRYWLISKGQKIFERALANSDELAELIDPNERSVSFEEFGYLAATALDKKRAKRDRAGAEDIVVRSDEPNGIRFDESNEKLARRYPKLIARFGDRPLPS